MDDKEHIYDTQVSPLVQQLLKVCQDNGIPMFATFQFSDTGFCTSALEEQGHRLIRHMRALSQCAEEDRVNVERYLRWVAKGAVLAGEPAAGIAPPDPPPPAG